MNNKKRISLKELLVSMLLKDAKGTMIWCDFCGSPYIEYSNVKKTEYNNAVKVSYNVECKKCGAKGVVIETWNK